MVETPEEDANAVQENSDETEENAAAEVEEAKSENVAHIHTRRTVWMPTTHGNLQGSEESDYVPLWLITFTDIMALMLTFFVMIYTMSVPVEEKWEELTSAFDAGFSKFQSAKWYGGAQDTISIDKLDSSRGLDLDYLETVVQEIINAEEKLENVAVISQKDRLILSLPSDLLFEGDQTEVTVSGKRAIFSLGGPLSRIRNRVEVVGHTDPNSAGYKDAGFNSGWDFSLMRAANVAAVLETVGYARSITLRGLAGGRYAELPLDLDERERSSLARRVDIVIMKDDGSQRLLSRP